MTAERDDVIVHYFVLCDYVLTEAGSGKQSLIGVYSALQWNEPPFHLNVSVALGLRVQSARPRDIMLRLNGPDGALVYASPPLPFQWEAVRPAVEAAGFATLQLGVNLRAVPFETHGVYLAALYCDGDLLATYPLAVTPSS